MKNLAIFPLVEGHNSRTVKVTPLEFNHNLCFVVISIVYRFHNIWLSKTKEIHEIGEQNENSAIFPFVKGITLEH